MALLGTGIQLPAARQGYWKGRLSGTMPGDRMLRSMMAVGLCIPLIAGCGNKAPKEFTTIAPDPAVYIPQDRSSNAFDDYVKAAALAEQAGGKYLERVSFYPAQRKAASDAAGPAVQLVIQGTKKPCEFRFTTTAPFTEHRYHQGWLLIGRVLTWRVEDGVKQGRASEAIDAALQATRFGFDLTGGGAMDAALGFRIIDQVRAALLPALNRMDASQLATLSQGLHEAMTRRVTLARTISHEEQNMLLAVQTVQDRFRQDRLSTLQEELKSSVNDAVEYLANLKKEDAEEQVAYFSGFAAEAKAMSETARKCADLSAKDRADFDTPLAEVRPWRRFARHFFGTIEPLFALSDATVARTRLLYLTAVLKLQVLDGETPSLKDVEKEFTIDPYSGREFVLMSDDRDFSLYSVGPNLVDDGGETDATFTRPDLKLESP